MWRARQRLALIAFFALHWTTRTEGFSVFHPVGAPSRKTVVIRSNIISKKGLPLLSESAQGRNVKCFTSSGDSSIGEVVGDEAELDREQEVLVAPSEDSPASSRSSSLETTATATASKKEMLRFALPALGIYLSNPLLSNIDNAFVGRTVGTAGLAALSPATICTDQMLYLFSFLSRATTSIVSRAYALKEDGSSGNAEAAREAASAPLTVSLICGACLSLVYACFTPSMLAGLRVDPALRPAASSYIYWRGAIAWAALAQAACLSTMMATRDAISPLKIIGLAAAANVLADFLLCAWPWRLGCAGAAAATSLATLLSCGFMLRGLAKKNILPKIKLPSLSKFKELLDFTGPLLLITITRLGGFIAMQRTAMKLGVQSLAGYQVCINLMMFFLLFGEPLSQLSQTKLPSLLDQSDGPAVFENLKSALTLAGITSIGVGAVAFCAACFGSGAVSSDVGVQLIAKSSAPALFIAVATSIFAVAVDGAMLASRDFGFMLLTGLGSFVAQLNLLPYCTSVSDILATFTFRLGTYAIAALARMGLGFGGVGRVVFPNKKRKSIVATKIEG